MELERYRIVVGGIVQGIGFRPFVHRLAESLFLAGTVRNTAEGVLIDIEGPAEALEAFGSMLVSDAPPLAVIETVRKEKLEYIGYKGFSIIPSEKGDKLDALVSPDICVCADCRRELFDPLDQRYLYPFINCTNCGPRYTIVCDIPYDRENTTMKNFRMCPACSAQYGDPDDRRYHAQPLCCPDCGPKVYLTPAAGRDVPDDESSLCGKEAGPIEKAAMLLAEGKILAVKSLGGYHLVCSALDGNAVSELRKRKFRDEKPFAVMARDIETVRKYCAVDDCAARLLQSAAAPIVLLRRRSDISLPEQIAPGNPELGVMLPYTPLQLLLFFKERDIPSYCPELLVMTSGNRSDEPICYEDEDAFARLGGIADYFLANDRPIRTRTDDSVVRVLRGKEYFIRRSRGYAPAPLIADAAILPQEAPPVLALGGELKNTFCLTKGNRFFLSQHIGDLENMETLDAYEDGIEHYKRLFDIEPAIVAYDMHPAYLSTAYAQGLSDIPKVPVQHHHAHIASCMADNNLAGDVIGVAFDGTGYGEDGNIWGGEFFTGNYASFKRAANLEYFRLPGSAAAVREPWRTAVACLRQCDYTVGKITEIFGNGISPDKVEFIAEMLEKNINSPFASSMGRLFDAVAAITGIKLLNRFEGQAAMALEHAASGRIGKPYCYNVKQQDGGYIIGINGIIRGVIDDIASGATAGMISERFHGTIACLVEDMCSRIREDSGLDRVVLSGGVFQNMLLLEACADKLQMLGFKVFIHRRVPANDGGISLGQAVIAVARRSDIC